MKKYILGLINHEIKITKGFIKSCQEINEKDILGGYAKKRLPILKKKLIKITKYKEQLEKIL